MLLEFSLSQLLFLCLSILMMLVLIFWIMNWHNTIVSFFHIHFHSSSMSSSARRVYRVFLSFSDVHQTIYLSLFILRDDRNVRDQAHQKLHDHDYSFGHTLQWRASLFPCFLSMACDLASRCPRRFPPNSLSNTVPFIMGTISEPIIQKYSLTASNALGESSLEFTLAVDKCPEGLFRLS